MLAGAAPGTIVARGPSDAATAAVAVRHGRCRFTARLTNAPSRELAQRVRERSEAAGLHPDVSLRGEPPNAYLDLVVDAGELDDCLDAASALLAGHARPTLVATGLSFVTVVTEADTPAPPLRLSLQAAVTRSGVAILAESRQPHRQAYLVTDRDAGALARALHDGLEAARVPSAAGARTAERIA
jgi:aspartokinase